jgi:hypothetical protein
LFCLIQASDQGLYVEMADPTQRYLLEYTFEQHPRLGQFRPRERSSGG